MPGPADPPDLPTAQYVTTLLDHYRRLPGCVGHIHASDRRLARQLADERVPLSLVQAAFTVAICRRTCRAGPPLPSVRSLHYFLAVIRELQSEPPDPDYLDHLRARLTRLSPSQK